MAERRKSLHSEQMGPKTTKRRRTMMDSISEVAKWILPSWASDEVADGCHDPQEAGPSGSMSNGTRAKRARLNDMAPSGTLGRLSPLDAAMRPAAGPTCQDHDIDDGSDSSSGCSSLSQAPVIGSAATAADKRSEDKFLQQRRQRPIQNAREAKTREVSTTVDQASLVAETSMSAHSQSINFSLYSRPSRALSSTMNTTFPTTNPESRSLSSSLHKPERSLNRSIFYDGKTTYGGASAHRKLNLFSSSPYQMAPRRQKPSTNVALPESSNAKRLIEVLERMKTPVQNAKKIPFARPDVPASQNPEDRRREALETIASLRQNPPPSLSTCKRTVAQARVGSNVKPTEFTIDLEETAAPNFSVITSTPRTVAGPSQDSERAGGKMKSNKINPQRQRKVIPEEEVSSDLPPAAPLPIASLPKFSFTPSKSSQSFAQDVAKPPATRSPLTSLADFSNKPFEKHASSPSCNSDSGDGFTFAEPLSLDKPNKEIGGCKEEFCFKDPLYLNRDSSKSGFTFTAPVIFMESPAAAKKEQSVNPFCGGSVMDVLSCTGKDLNQNQTKQWECSKCSILNKSDISSCTVCETKKSEAPLPTSGFGNLFKKDPGSWSCSSCMLQNKADASKCVACETPNAAAEAKDQPPSLSEMFKKTEGQWTCQTCMLSNGPSTQKCIACEAPKAPSQPAKVPFSSTKLKMEPGWSCDTCLIRNILTATKCIACETPKDGAAPAAPSTPAPSAFKFGVPSTPASTGDKPAVDATPIFGNNAVKVDSTPVNGFKFGLTEIPKEKEATPVVKSTESTAKMTFGMPASPATTTASTTSTSGFGNFSFGNPSTPAEKKPEPEKTAASFSFGLSTPAAAASDPKSGEPAKLPAFSFGAQPKELAAPAAVFSFGATVKPAAEAAPTTSSFSFAVVSSPSAPSSVTFGTAATPASSTSAFGSTTTVTASSAQSITSSGFSMTSSAPSSASAATEAPKTSPVFTFGATPAQPAQSSTTNPPAFVFGNPAATPTAGFNFGAAAAATPASGAPAFTFGQTPAATTSAFGAAPAAPSSGFGAPPAAASAGFGATPAASSTGFGAAPPASTSFGSAPAPFGATPTTTASVFGASTPAKLPAFTPAAATPAAPGFGSGLGSAPPAPAFGSSTSAFGATPAPNALFQFGAAQKTTAPAPAPAPSSFTFQQSTPSPMGFAFGATAAPAPAGGAATPALPTPFQFGNAAAAPTTATSAPNEMFSFGSAPAAPAANFQFGMQPPAGGTPAPFPFTGAPAPNAFPGDNPFNVPPGRKVRKALRRQKPR